MKNTSLLLLVTGIFIGCSTGIKKQLDNYDIVIINGRVMNPETNFDGIRNVGIKGERNTIITD